MIRIYKLKYTDKEKAIADLSASVVVDSTSNIIRRANRVLLVAYQEMENSEARIQYHQEMIQILQGIKSIRVQF